MTVGRPGDSDIEIWNYIVFIILLPGEAVRSFTLATNQRAFMLHFAAKSSAPPMLLE